jgi:hypothetical protein
MLERCQEGGGSFALSTFGSARNEWENGRASSSGLPTEELGSRCQDTIALPPREGAAQQFRSFLFTLK